MNELIALDHKYRDAMKRFFKFWEYLDKHEAHRKSFVGDCWDFHNELSIMWLTLRCDIKNNRQPSEEQMKKYKDKLQKAIDIMEGENW